jgi:hypothetical protein
LVHDESMVEIVRVLAGVLVVASFGTLAVYVLVSTAVAASTLLGAFKHDRSAGELDQVLAEILGSRTPGTVADPGRSRSTRRR